MTTDIERKSLIRRLIDAARSPAQEPIKKAQPQRTQRSGLSFGDILLSSSRFTTVNTLEDENTDRAYRLAMTTAWSYSDIDLISTRLASTEFEIKRRVKKGKKGEDSELEDVKGHPAQTLLRMPNTLMSGSFLVDMVTTWFLLRGNGYIFISSQGPGTGSPMELWPLEAANVTPRPDTAHLGRGAFSGRLIVDYDVLVNGQLQTLPGENVIHWRTVNPWDYWQGLSPLVALNSALNIDFFQSTWLGSFYGEDNAVPSSIISLPPEITDDIFEESAKLIRQEFAAKRRTAITRAGDMKVEVIEQSIKDMELIGSREFNRKLIDRVFGVPEGLTSGSLSGDSRLAAEITFARNTIQPMLNNLASAMTSRLSYLYGDADLVVAAPDVVPQDRAMDLQEFSAHKTVMTVNEARKELGLEKHPHELAEVPIELLPIVAEQWKAENVKQPDPYGNAGPGGGPQDLFPGEDQNPDQGGPTPFPGQDQGPEQPGQNQYPGEDQGPGLDQGQQFPWTDQSGAGGKKQKGQADVAGAQSAANQVRQMTGKSAGDAVKVAATEDLKRWRKVALGEVRAGRWASMRKFESDYIPEGLHAEIAKSLLLAGDEETVKAVFDRAFSGLEEEAEYIPYKRGEVTYALEVADPSFFTVLEGMNEKFKEVKGLLADYTEADWAALYAQLDSTKHLGPGPHPSGSPQAVHGELGDGPAGQEESQVWARADAVRARLAAHVQDGDPASIRIDHGVDMDYVEELAAGIEKADALLPGPQPKRIWFRAGAYSINEDSRALFYPRSWTIEDTEDAARYGEVSEPGMLVFHHCEDGNYIRLSLEASYNQGWSAKRTVGGLVAHEWTHVSTYEYEGPEEIIDLYWESLTYDTIKKVIGEYATMDKEEFAAELVAWEARGTPKDYIVAPVRSRFLLDLADYYTQNPVKHMGPGPHPDGSPQSVHGRRGGMAAWRAQHGAESGESPIPSTEPLEEEPWKRMEWRLYDENTIIAVSPHPDDGLKNVIAFDIRTGEAFMTANIPANITVDGVIESLRANGDYQLQDARQRRPNSRAARPWERPSYGEVVWNNGDLVSWAIFRDGGVVLNFWDSRTSEFIGRSPFPETTNPSDAINTWLGERSERTAAAVRDEMLQEAVGGYYRGGSEAASEARRIAMERRKKERAEQKAKEKADAALAALTPEEKTWLESVTKGAFVPGILGHAKPMASNSTVPDVLNGWDSVSGGAPVSKLRAMFEPKLMGGSGKIATLNGSEGILHIGGTFSDASGRRIAEYSITLTPGKAHHGHLVIADDQQGAGLAALAVEALEDQYKSIGVKQVTLIANYEVGGYAWARMGYDFIDAYQEEPINDAFAMRLSREKGLAPVEMTGDPDYKRFVKLHHAWQKATYEYNGVKIGKEVMLGSQWDAVKVLGGEGDRIGEEYLRERLAKGMQAATKSITERRPKKVSTEPGWCTVAVDGGYGDAAVWDDIDGPVDDAWHEAVRSMPVKHYGPGPHPDGSPQSVHAGDDSLATAERGDGGRPFEVDEVLLWYSPNTGEEMEVSFRGWDEHGDCVVYSKKSGWQGSVSPNWLRHKPQEAWNGPDERAKNWIAAAKSEFGITADYNEAGYVLPDGTMLDFSGKRHGGQRGERGLDHRQIGEAEPEDEQKTGDATDRMIRFMKTTGAIRFVSYADVFTLESVRPLTEAQIYRLARLPAVEFSWTVSDLRGYEKDAKDGDKWGPEALDEFDQALRKSKWSNVKHGGPGPHEGTGTSQNVHSGDIDTWVQQHSGGRLVAWNLPYGGLSSTGSTPETVRAAWSRATDGAPMERLFEMFEVEGDGYVSLVDAFDTPNGDYALGVYGHLEDAKGKKVAEYYWVIQPDVAYLEHIVFDKALQGAGIGGSFTETMEDSLSQVGVKRIEMVANYDVGGYAWAKMGYDFAQAEPGSEEYIYNQKTLAKVKDAIRENICISRRISSADWPKHPAAIALEQCKHSWDYAAFTWGGVNWGKSAMLGRKWYAEKVIGSEGDRMGAMYNAAKRQFSKKVEEAEGATSKSTAKLSAEPGWMTVKVGDGYSDAPLWPDIDGPADEAWHELVKEFLSNGKPQDTDQGPRDSHPSDCG